jgi:hypothetical protein
VTPHVLQEAAVVQAETGKFDSHGVKLRLTEEKMNANLIQTCSLVKMELRVEKHLVGYQLEILSKNKKKLRIVD